MYFTVTDNYSKMLRDAELPEHLVRMLKYTLLTAKNYNFIMKKSQLHTVQKIY